MDKSKIKPVSLNELLWPLRRSWGIVLIAFFSVVFTVSYFTFYSERVYEASATLYIREDGNLPGQLFDIPSMYRQKHLIKDQITILKSRTLAADVVRRFQASAYRDSLIILGNKTSKERSSFVKRLFVLFKKNDSIKGKPSFQSIVNRFNLATKVSYTKDTDIIKLRGRSSDPWEAAYIVNIWVHAYQDFNRSGGKGELIQTKRFLESKLKEMEKKLAMSENLLAKYKKQKKVVSLSEETEQLVAQLTSFESLYNQTRTELDALENELKYLKNQLDESRKNLVEDMVKLSNPVLQALQKQMAKLVAEKAAYEAQLLGAGLKSTGDVRLSQMENRLNGIKEKIIEETKKLADHDFSRISPLDHSENLITKILELETSQQSLRAKTEALKLIVEEYSRKLETLPDLSLNLARLERDVQVNTKIYVMLKEKYEETRIREAGHVSISRVIDRAEPPLNYVYPKTFINLFLGCFFGLLVGIGLAFGREYFLNSIRDENDLDDIGIRVIGGVPFIKREKIHFSFRRKPNDWNIVRAREILPYLINQRNGYSPVAEAYRAIRTSISFAKDQKKCKTILFTSTGPAEGKSTTAANLAISMAQKGVKTLLVDSDLRKPVLDILFMGSPRKVGLTNHLARELKWCDAVRETATTGLYLLAAGPRVKNASEVLSSRSMQLFIEEAKKEYGLIIFDSPPLLPVTDAAVLASVVDGVILVVRAGKTSREGIKHSIDILKGVGTEVLGTVLTGSEKSSLYGYRYYYDKYPVKKKRNEN